MIDDEIEIANQVIIENVGLRAEIERLQTANEYAFTELTAMSINPPRRTVMSDYKPEDERKPFNVRNASPEVIEAHIGDLEVEIERLRAVLDQIEEIAFQAQRSNDKPPGHLAQTVDPEILG